MEEINELKAELKRLEGLRRLSKKGWRREMSPIPLLEKMIGMVRGVIKALKPFPWSSISNPNPDAVRRVIEAAKRIT